MASCWISSSISLSKRNQTGKKGQPLTTTNLGYCRQNCELRRVHVFSLSFSAAFLCSSLESSLVGCEGPLDWAVVPAAGPWWGSRECNLWPYYALLSRWARKKKHVDLPSSIGIRSKNRRLHLRSLVLNTDTGGDDDEEEEDEEEDRMVWRGWGGGWGWGWLWRLGAGKEQEESREDNAYGNIMAIMVSRW